MPYKETKNYSKWDKENNIRMNIKLSKRADEDILNFLSTCENKNGCIKVALRYYIAAGCPEVDKQTDEAE